MAKTGSSSPGIPTPVVVSKGGTGVRTLTGMAKGRGTDTFYAAVVGSDYIDPENVAKITVGPIAPTNPSSGDIWIDTSQS